MWAYGRTILCSWPSLTCTRNQRITFAIAARLFNDLWMGGAHLLHFSGLALPRGALIELDTLFLRPSLPPSTAARVAICGSPRISIPTFVGFFNPKVCHSCISVLLFGTWVISDIQVNNFGCIDHGSETALIVSCRTTRLRPCCR